MMKELKDLAAHPFDSKVRSNVQNYIYFSAPLLGQGTLGCYAPCADISILYISCRATEDFIWKNNINSRKSDAFYFNYFLKVSHELQAMSEDRKSKRSLVENTLLVDGTLSAEKSLILVKDEIFEIFQVALSTAYLESLLNEYLTDFTPEIINFCYRKSTDRSQVGLTLPIESREEMCIREIVNCPLEINLQNEYTVMKVKELILYYLQRMVNGGVLEVSDNKDISVREKEKLINVKTFLEQETGKDPDYGHLCELAEMNKQKLNVLFEKVFGQSIARYHRTQKMQRACNLLLDFEKNLSINEIAFQLGFSSVSSFSRAFYNEFKKRPTGFRIG